MEANQNEVREFQLKSKLATLCNQKLKAYAKHKKDKNKNNPRMRLLCSTFIQSRQLTPKYAIYLLIIFGREFDEIKTRMLNKTLNFEHISHEEYWNKGAANIVLVDAIFFSCVYYSEAYPLLYDVLLTIEENVTKNKDFDIVQFIESELNQ